MGIIDDLNDAVDAYRKDTKPRGFFLICPVCFEPMTEEADDHCFHCGNCGNVEEMR